MEANANIEKLVKAAKEKEWEVVDKEIPNVCNDRTTVSWAYDKGIYDEDDNVRDLAVSILEKSRILVTRFDIMRPTIHRLMKIDHNNYVRYRAAFTLAAHGAGEFKKEVEQVLHEAEEDPDVSEIAKQYLTRI